jgi:hypothetical protein
VLTFRMKTILRIAAANSQSATGYTIAPVEAADDSSSTVVPEFIRLPKPGSRDPFTGLSRSFLYELILPSEANGFKPPVRSVHLRKRGAVRGVRLIVLDSLIKYLHSKSVQGG